MMIAPLDVVQRNSDLKNTLIQPSDWPLFFTPEIFESLVLFEELTAVELGDALAQFGRRRFAAWQMHNNYYRGYELLPLAALQTLSKARLI